MNISEWALKWGVPAAALDDLRASLFPYVPPSHAADRSESSAQAEVRLEASRKGKRLWRNNNGVLPDRRGTPVHFGLANESKKVNSVTKSSDLIGIQPILITPALVGATIGQFMSIEMKHRDWTFTGTPEEVAQRNWLELIISFGGYAAFATGGGTL
jgi:hypothetical protein